MASSRGKFWVFVPLWWTLRSNPNGVLAHVSSGRLRWRMLRGNVRSRRPGGEERRGGRGGEGGGAGWPEVQCTVKKLAFGMIWSYTYYDEVGLCVTKNHHFVKLCQVTKNEHCLSFTTVDSNNTSQTLHHGTGGWLPSSMNRQWTSKTKQKLMV